MKQHSNTKYKVPDALKRIICFLAVFFQEKTLQKWQWPHEVLIVKNDDGQHFNYSQACTIKNKRMIQMKIIMRENYKICSMLTVKEPK